MNKIYGIIAAGLTTILTILSVFLGGVQIGKRKKDAEILRNSVKDALETKRREELRNNDSIDDVVKRMRDYANK